MDEMARSDLIENSRKKGDLCRVIELSTNSKYFMDAVKRFACVVNCLGERANFTEILEGLGREGLELMSKAESNFADIRNWLIGKGYLSWRDNGPYFLTTRGKGDLLGYQQS